MSSLSDSIVLSLFRLPTCYVADAMWEIRKQRCAACVVIILYMISYAPMYNGVITPQMQ